VDCTYIKQLPAVRYFIPKEQFAGFRYVYMGDVDMIIMNELNNDFRQFYVDHCVKTGLPFSNMFTSDNGQMRMTGLHFMEVEPYFEKMNDLIAEVIGGRNVYALGIMNSYCFDEQVLYNMTSRAFDIEVLRGYRRPHNGVHIGYVRDRPVGHSYARKTRIEIWNRHRGKIDKIFNHNIFKQICNNMGPRAKDCMNRIKYVLDYRLFL
jgi:hypothetical protein